MMPAEKTIDKVLKLLAKAESTTEAEAEALTAKAAELMMREAIDEAMLAEARGQVVDVIETRKFKFGRSYAIPMQELAHAVAHGHGFKVLQSSYDRVYTSTWVGWRSELGKAEVLLTSLLIQQDRAARDYAKAWKLEHPGRTSLDRFYAQRDFMLGFAAGTKGRLLKARAGARTSAKADAGARSSSVELVLVSREQQVDEWYDERYGKLRRGRSRSLQGSAGGYQAGRAAAMAADHGQGRVQGGVRGALS